MIQNLPDSIKTISKDYNMMVSIMLKNNDHALNIVPLLSTIVVLMLMLVLIFFVNVDDVL